MRNLQYVVLMVSVCGILVGCKVKKEQECVDPPEVAAAKAKSGTTTEAAKQTVIDKDADWCRACVVGPHGFMSCQRKSATSSSDTKDVLRERARIAACTDSGFTADNCPKDKIIGLVCKGDPEPKDKRAAGNALLKALKSSGPLVLTDDKEALARLKKRAAEEAGKAASAPKTSPDENAQSTAPKTPPQ
jgi:hypothetical protein